MYLLLSVFVASSESISNPSLKWNKSSSYHVQCLSVSICHFFAKAPFQPFPIGIQSWEWWSWHRKIPCVSFRWWATHPNRGPSSDVAQEVSLKQDSSCAFSLCFWHSDWVKVRGWRDVENTIRFTKSKRPEVYRWEILSIHTWQAVGKMWKLLSGRCEGCAYRPGDTKKRLKLIWRGISGGFWIMSRLYKLISNDTIFCVASGNT